MISLIDTNLYFGAFYLESKSSTKLFKGVQNLKHRVGICPIQLYEIQSVFEIVHKNRFRDTEVFRNNYFMVQNALTRFNDWYQSPRVIKLSSDYHFDERSLTLDDQRKYNLLKIGNLEVSGVESHDNKT